MFTFTVAKKHIAKYYLIEHLAMKVPLTLAVALSHDFIKIIFRCTRAVGLF